MVKVTSDAGNSRNHVEKGRAHARPNGKPLKPQTQRENTSEAAEGEKEAEKTRLMEELEIKTLRPLVPRGVEILGLLCRAQSFPLFAFVGVSLDVVELHEREEDDVHAAHCDQDPITSTV